MMDDSDSIVIDVNANIRNTRKILLCVIDKIQLEYIAERTYKCPKCHNQYYLGIEILENEDIFESAHQDENIELQGIQGINKPIIEIADDIIETEEEEEKKSGFYSMDYIKGPGKTIVEYEEEIPSSSDNEWMDEKEEY